MYRARACTIDLTDNCNSICVQPPAYIPLHKIITYNGNSLSIKNSCKQIVSRFIRWLFKGYGGLGWLHSCGLWVCVAQCFRIIKTTYITYNLRPSVNEIKKFMKYESFILHGSFLPSVRTVYCTRYEFISYI